MYTSYIIFIYVKSKGPADCDVEKDGLSSV